MEDGMSEVTVRTELKQLQERQTEQEGRYWIKKGQPLKNEESGAGDNLKPWPPRNPRKRCTIPIHPPPNERAHSSSSPSLSLHPFILLQTGGKTRSALQDVVTREYTVHLHKLVHGRSFKKRAPWAVKSVVTFAQKAMGTSDVRIDPKLNQALWAQGIKTVPHRIRIKLERKRNDEENAKEKLFTYASHVPVVSFKGLQTAVVDAE
ncbi:hypothetical protein CONPUDRAFT_166494 [Coniophora puteana RWD-64-598 SS2]|uniref:60S ribosomal protein L31 n=1 Tax=Coniophora puteana (strain RWD-64-598) TaxID=741705 RepID=A0A5M3MKP6_CONPW|nr:uncharacterized protein CONPUDRAFT_166494 [Coniophora puteana RWD-64-598 SS2]EIW79792.1 hypothetical protein CONPUDRAFT_166494 [Coniophora puteana RWD-64-598 SS2]